MSKSSPISGAKNFIKIDNNKLEETILLEVLI